VFLTVIVVFSMEHTVLRSKKRAQNIIIKLYLKISAQPVKIAGSPLIKLYLKISAQPVKIAGAESGLRSERIIEAEPAPSITKIRSCQALQMTTVATASEVSIIIDTLFT
jgi:hypothetical protein